MAARVHCASIASVIVVNMVVNITAHRIINIMIHNIKEKKNCISKTFGVQLQIIDLIVNKMFGTTFQYCNSCIR
jgi:hypothetical protein